MAENSKMYFKLLLLGILSILVIHYGMFSSKKHMCGTSMKNISLLKLKIFVDDSGELWLPHSEYSGSLRINTNDIGVNKFMILENFVNVHCGEVKKRFLNDNKMYMRTALASIPGSGNTWVRHLIEEMTGIYTGSIYHNGAIQDVFLGENTTEKVIVVKTHRRWNNPGNGVFERAVLIVRDPFEATLAEYNRRKTSQTKIISLEDFNKTEFSDFFGRNVENWLAFNKDWMLNIPGQTFVLFYDKLKSDLGNSLAKLSRFLGTEVTLEKLWCVNLRKEGLFHRPPKPEWMSRSNLVTFNLKLRITALKKLVLGICRARKYQYRIKTNL